MPFLTQEPSVCGGWVYRLPHACLDLIAGSVDGCYILQGVVTYMSPVKAFATAIKFLDWQKVCFIA